MTTFLRLLNETDKAAALLEVCSQQRAEGSDPRVFEVAPEAFDAVPGKPFAYWVSEAVRETFRRLPAFEGEGRTARLGGSTKNDFRFLRAWWEISGQWTVISGQKWFLFAKGGAFSLFYADVYLVVNWQNNAREIEAELLMKFPYLGDSADFVLHRNHPYLRPGLTWPLRTNGLSFRAMPAGGIFGHKGPAAFVAHDDPDTLLALSALLNNRAFGLLVSVQLARTELAQSYEVGLIQQTPIPPLPSALRLLLSQFARRAWSLKRTLDTINETSHAFHLPAALANLPTADIEAELARIQAEIDVIAFDLYGFSEADRQAATLTPTSLPEGAGQEEDEEEATESLTAADSHLPALLSWAVGVACGRFDWRLATGERAAPAEPEPFDPLPAKSPGMLPDGAVPFHTHAGILVDDPGHPHHLARLIEEVLVRVNAPIPEDVRRWLQRDFFPFHLQRYSKSRRKAPIYWPLATTSGSYTLWVYYPSLTSQTLYSAINDFVEPKLKHVGAEISRLKADGRGQNAEGSNPPTAYRQLPSAYRQLPSLQDLELELIELRDTLLKLAPTYKPNHDDGVQISAAPLWPLFRHKPWQKVLKDTWAKLEKGDYDWAHLAMSYWPDRVRGKCKTDKSLAIAHGLEDLYIEPEAVPKKARGRKAKGA